MLPFPRHLAALGPCCWPRLSLLVASGGHAELAACRLLTAVAPLLQSTVPEAPGLRSLVLGLSSPAACGLFPDQRLNVPLMLAGEFLSTGPPGKSTLVFKSLPYLVDVEESGLHSPHPHISFRTNSASDVPVRSSFCWRKICIQ